ncbi:hypothetical protein M408DRAFT_331653, partial [Serendipita vermifera MAFF 305830]
MNNPALCDPIRTPRNPIVLAHGLYGFDVRGFTGWPKVQIHYWSDVLQVLRKKVGAEVIVTRVPSTGSIQERASVMHEGLKLDAKGRQINFIAHSMVRRSFSRWLEAEDVNCRVDSTAGT